MLCGHSLGGAVATLAAVAILAESDESRSAAELRCVAFASPPVGNSALRRAVWERGWGPAFTNVCVPEDPVPRLLFTPQRGAAAARSTGRDSRPRGIPAGGKRRAQAPAPGPDGATVG